MTATAVADDWPQWRGIDRDGRIDEPGLMQALPDGHLPRKWTVEIGAGYSGPTVANGRVYVTDRGLDQDDTEIERVLCFDAETGQEVWKHSYPAVYGDIGYRAGPRASVTIHGDSAISVGAAGQLICFAASDGTIRWQHDLRKAYDARMPIWGITAAPLVYKDLVIQVVAGAGDACVVAFDLWTGKESWRSIDEPAGYSSPILIRQAGQDVAVVWTGASISGLDPKSGRVHWRVEMLPRNMPIGVPTPVVADDLLFVSSFYDGSMLIRFSKDELTAQKVWHRAGTDEINTDALHCMISNPLIKGDHIYGTDSYGQLRCLDIATGDRVWEDTTAVPKARWATIHTIRDGDREIMQNDQGELIFATLSPAGYQEHSRTKLLAPTRKQLPKRGGVTWSHPAIANGHIYARNDNELMCASLLP
ncbi:PQQ-binding-like beta-propeller repeat protein [Rubripirellula tenax]|uniref:PQQ-binding-like beta-propeller repeat protein n=1 Tax=Rubripirellula tenax TaxID=2528015 RepID=UPI001FEADDC0|nr:PQQ-binding-like beta-propeller repeat protein [Rubripirellula tenax]